MNKKSITVIGFALASLVILATACTTVEQKDTKITTTELTQHIGVLASDSLTGRYPGEGALLAADYIHAQLLSYGLTPIIENGFQAFKVVTGCTLGENNTLLIEKDSLQLKNDFMPVAFSADMQAEGQVAFAGYGFEIETKTLKWNDYAMLKAEGKWVLILRNDPEPDNMMSEFIPYASDRAKVTLAKDKGAIGVLLVNGVNTSKRDKTMPLSYDQNLSDAGLPVISITRKVANKLLESSTIEAMETEMIEQKKSIVISTNKTITASTSVIQEKTDAKNVVFELKSTANPSSDKYIVIGAHYDHLGMGGKSVNSRMPDTIAVHNGADDNASGVAGIIELAGFLSTKTDTLQHHVLIVAFDAEEMGVLGSKYFTQNSPVAKENITAMFNFDMIGRMKDDTAGLTIGGTGTALEIDSLLDTYQPYFGVHRSTDGYGPSDHAPFYSNNIPVMFFSTGAHSDYHTPLDDIEKLSIDKETDILNYATDLILAIASKDQQLTFQSTGSAGKSNRKTRLKVTLGIIPDVAGVVKNGLGIDGVRGGGPAEKAGITKGDKITAINGEEVTNIYDYMFRLAKLKPETTAIIEIERAGKKEVLLVQL